MMSTTMKTTINLPLSISELLNEDGAFRRSLEDLAPQTIEKGQSLRIIVRMGDSITSGATLKRVILAFSNETPLRNDQSQQVFEVDFLINGNMASWLSPPLTLLGEFHFYLLVELEEADSASPVTGNRILVAYPEMVVSDDPPITIR